MAIAHDATSTDTSAGTANLSVSHTAAGADRIAVVGITIRSGTVTGGTPTYGGVNMVSAGAITESTTVRSELWYLVNPATGAQTVACTLSGSARAFMHVSTYTGVDQSTPIGTAVTASATTGNPTVDATSAAGELVVDTVGGVWTATNTAFTVDASQTQRANGTDNNGSAGCIHGASDEGGAATTTMSWTKPIAGEDWAQVAVPLKPASSDPYVAAVTADSPTAYWRLGEPSGTTAADETGSHAGTYVNTPTLGVAGVTADADTAATFASASSEYVTTTTLGTLGSNLVTSSWEFWIKTTTSAIDVIAGTMNTGFTTFARLYTNADGNIASSAGSTAFSFRDEASNILSGAITTNIYDGAWHHVVVVIASTTTVEFYVDGVARTVSYASSGPLGATADFGFALTLAALNNRATIESHLEGSLDEVAVYPTRLTSTRVAAHYAARAVAAVASTRGQMLLTGVGG